MRKFSNLTLTFRTAMRWTATLVVLLAAAASAQAADVPPLKFDTAFETVDPYVQTTAMHRGMNVLGWDPIWQDPAQGRFQPRHFARLHQAGFDTVRIVLNAFVHMDDADRMDPVWLSTLDTMLAAALQNGLTVILDLHDVRLCGVDAETCKRKANAFWTQIGTRYRDAPSSVIFEMMNEPHGALTAPVWNAMLPEILATIRATNPTRNVIIGPAGWSSADQLATFELPADDQHIIVTVHYYWPMTFTHQGAHWVTETAGLSGVTWGTPADRAKVATDFDAVKVWSDAHHRPIFLGEFGAYDRGDIVSRMRYDGTVARAAEARGFPWAYWQFDSDFIAYDMTTDDWVQPILYALVPPRG
jgi:endoglucanase